MGTNFYLKGHRGDNDPQFHIGKRSAAGQYCWDCGITLCKSGEEGIHGGTSRWHRKCPKCGQQPTPERLEESSAGRELGFNKSKPRRKKGVKSCSSFTWARAGLGDIPEKGKPIEDEYGQKYSLLQFLGVLEECPINFYEFRKWFS